MERSPNQTNLRVLIVEDSAVLARRIRNELDELNEISIVGEALDSKEALIILQVMQPDVVLLDIGIPGKSGIHVLKEIKEKYPQTKVIILTNYSESYYRNFCTDLGADYFFDKTNEFDKIPGTLLSMQSQRTNDPLPCS